MEIITNTCPGCGLKNSSNQIIINGKYNASEECLELYWKLSFYTLSLRDDFFIHQYIVDAYAAQHASIQTKPIKTAFALFGLYLAIEHGYTGKEVQNAHIFLASKNKNWPKFIPPKVKSTLNVLDVIKKSDDKKEEMIKQWMSDVWNSWKENHTEISKLVKRYINI